MKRFLALLALAGAVTLGNHAMAGTTTGPKFQVGTVAPAGADSYTNDFLGGLLAQVTVEGYVDLYVYDQFGTLIAADTNGSGFSTVRWYPRWTGPFVIRVVNRGIVYNRYVIVAN